MGGYQSKQAITRLEHALFSQREESKRKPPARGRGRHAPDALEAQKRKRLELEAKETGRELSGLDEEEKLPPARAVEDF